MVSLKKKIAICLITLGLSLSGFCVSFFTPATAQAFYLPMNQMHADNVMANQPMVSNCGDDVASSLNCCIAPDGHGNFGFYETKNQHDLKQKIQIVYTKVQETNSAQNIQNSNFHLFKILPKGDLSPGLTGQIVKRE